MIQINYKTFHIAITINKLFSAAILLLPIGANITAAEYSDATSEVQSTLRLFCGQRGRIVLQGGGHHPRHVFQHRGRELDGRCAGAGPVCQRDVSHQLRVHAERQLVCYLLNLYIVYSIIYFYHSVRYRM